jgi:hypothetical protein
MTRVKGGERLSKGEKPVNNLTTAAPQRTGRDEMNLAEFPLSLLAQRTTVGTLSFTKERSLTLPNGMTLAQTWIVTGAPEYGLPQPTDEDVLLGLLKISCDNGFISPQVHFTQRGLLGILHWPAQGWTFRRLEQALARLKTTNILARNAFWNNEQKAYQTRHFGIIEEYELLNQQGGAHQGRRFALSSNWVLFSRQFFSSIQAGYLKPLDLDLYFNLRSALSKRLYRFLDKKRYQKQRFEINLQLLASVHLGLSDATCQYPSWIKKDLDRAHAELTECGFLATASYSHARSGDWKVSYQFRERTARCEQLSLPLPKDETAELREMLIHRGVSASVARELVQSKPAQLVSAQLEVFDHLTRLTQPKRFHNPAGFLTEAIRQEWNLRPPGFSGPRRPAPPAQPGAAAPARDPQDPALEQEKSALAALRASLPETSLQALQEEAYRQARAQLSTTYRLRKDSPLVEAFLNGLLKEKYLSAAS